MTDQTKPERPLHHEIVLQLSRLLSKDRLALYNGVVCRDRSPLDGGDYYPDHKAALCRAVRSEVSEGDEVVVVGGGRGVIPTLAARAGASVTVIEAAREMTEILKETRALNEVDFKIVHGVVGTARDVYGDDTDARPISPDELEGDVLVLDCEGSERDILPVNGFGAVVVETHPAHGAPTEDVVAILGTGEVVGADGVDGDIVVARSE